MGKGFTNIVLIFTTSLRRIKDRTALELQDDLMALSVADYQRTADKF
jgi:hypothetical protein